MQPNSQLSDIFQAYTRICAEAYTRIPLISCPTLTKAPHYGDVLRRYLTNAQPKPVTKKKIAFLAWRYLRNNFVHFCFMLLCKAYVFALGWKRPACLAPAALAQADKPLVVVDTFAVLPKIAAEGCYKEMYMPGLYEAAVTEGYNAIRLYRLYGSRNPVVVWKALRVLAEQGDGLLEVHLLNWKDWGRLLRHIAVYPPALVRLIRSLRGYTGDAPQRHIKEALVNTAGQCALFGEARRLAGFRLGMLCSSWWSAQRMQAPAVISWHENQPINKGFNHGVRQARQEGNSPLRIVGAQLFTWPDGMLHYQADDTEIPLQLTPDKVFVTGKYFFPEHSSQEFAVGPALRYAGLFAPAVPRRIPQEYPGVPLIPGEADTNTLLVLLSYHPDAVCRVLDVVRNLALGGGKVVYKFHPTSNPQDYRDKLPDNAVILSGSLAEAVAGAGAIIGSGSGALPEAVVLGVPVIHVDDATGLSGLNHSFLPEFGRNELWASIRHGGELPEALQLLLAFKAGPHYEEKRQQFRDMLFTEPTPERIRELLRG